MWASVFWKNAEFFLWHAVGMVVFLVFFTYAFLYDLKSVRKNTVQKRACMGFFTLKKCVCVCVCEGGQKETKLENPERNGN